MQYFPSSHFFHYVKHTRSHNLTVSSQSHDCGKIKALSDGLLWFCRLCKRRQWQLHMRSARQTFHCPRRCHSSPLCSRYQTASSVSFPCPNEEDSVLSIVYSK